MDRRTFLAGAGCGVSALGAGCITGTPLNPDVTESETKTYDVEAGTMIGVDNRDGSVTIEGYDGDDVTVDVEKSGTRDIVESTSLTTDEGSDSLVLRTEFDESIDDGDATVSLRVRCPRGVGVGRVRTTNGSVEVTNVAGNVLLESTNGSVTARSVDGPVALRTKNGSVTARDIGALRGAKTENAGIDVDVPALVGDTRIETDNGGVDALLAPDLDATVTATATNGSVDVERLDLSPSEPSSVSGTLGDGTHELEIETTNGGIDLAALSA